MYKNKKVVVIMPAYNAAKTIKKAYNEVIDSGIVDLVIVVDDASSDNTAAIAKTFEKTEVYIHPQNLGYGGNQKTCYQMALQDNADIIVMIHPDYQYTPQLLTAMVSLIGNGVYSCVIGSRIIGGQALKSGMPIWKYAANRVLTFTENLLIGAKLSEYHTGYRAFSRELLEHIPFEKNSNDFVFDNQMLAQICWRGYTIGEVSCPTKYFSEASSINFRRSVKYGFGCLSTAFAFRAEKLGLHISKRLVFKS